MSSPSSGSNTPWYRVVQGHFYPLVLNIEQVLSTTAALLFGKELISPDTLENAASRLQPEFERSSALMRKILKKIELGKKWYDAFLSVLHQVNELTDIADQLNTALIKEEDSSNASSLYPQHHPLPPPVRHCGRRHSDSDVVQSKTSRHYGEMDSGVTTDLDMQNSTFAAGDIVQSEEAEHDVFESQQPKLLLSDESTCRRTANAFTGARSDYPQRAETSSAALVFSHSSSDPASSANNDPVVCSSPPNGNVVHVVPIEHTSNDIGMLPPASATFSNSDNWNRKGEKDYLKSQNKEQASEISKLNQTIEQLEEDKAKSTEELKKKGKEISKKDNLIARLKKDCKEKDHYVGVLKKDKAEMEKAIENLQKKSQEEISKLQKDLEEVESREKAAQIDLAKAETKLANAMLEKEREISNLKDKFHKLKEMAAKEKELAAQRELAKEKELMALGEKELSTREELIEEKQKRAQDTVNRAKEEARQAQDSASRADKRRRESDLKMQELKIELERIKGSMCKEKSN